MCKVEYIKKEINEIELINNKLKRKDIVLTDGTEGNKLVLSGIDAVVIRPHSPHVSCTVDQPGRIKGHGVSQQTRN